MRFVLFYHSVISDWNHGNAHFLRGLMRALNQRGHTTVCYEAEHNWSLDHLLQEQPHAVVRFAERFPDLRYRRFNPADAARVVAEALADADVAVVHEWTEPALAREVVTQAQARGVPALFHDTHYRVVQDEAAQEALAVRAYDMVLAYSPSIAARYAALGYGNVHVLHEAADTTVFSPRERPIRDDVTFVGNYGGGDRSDEIDTYIFGPRRALPGLRFAMYGVRYPEDVVCRLRDDLDIAYRGWVANVDVPEVYARTRVALHVPRRQYVELLPGTPTIRVFEALACATCLVSLPWDDTDHLFTAGADYLVVHTPEEMRDTLAWLCQDDAARTQVGQHGWATIRQRHTCDHRAEQLLDLLA